MDGFDLFYSTMPQGMEIDSLKETQYNHFEQNKSCSTLEVLIYTYQYNDWEGAYASRFMSVLRVGLYVFQQKEKALYL